MTDSSIERVKVVIVGSGFAGLCMAIKLTEAGILFADEVFVGLLGDENAH